MEEKIMYTDPFASEESGCRRECGMERDMKRGTEREMERGMERDMKRGTEREMERGMERDMGRDTDCYKLPSNLPLGIAYVPMQIFRNLYEPAVGFERGTLFQELDLPFIGEGAKK